MSLTDDFIGHYENNAAGLRLAVNVSELISEYDQNLKQIAIQHNKPAVTSELAMKEITYMFSSEHHLMENIDGFCDLLIDQELEDMEEQQVDQNYADAVAGVVECLAIDFTLLLDKLKVMQYLKDNDSHCALDRVYGEHMVYVIYENGIF